MNKDRFLYPIDHAAFAVSDAVMVVQAELIKQMEYEYELKHLKIPEYLNDEQLLQTASFELCHIGSQSVVRHLVKKSRDLFNGIALVETNKRYGDLAGDWNFHTIFVARDRNMIWYVGSPANYHPNPEKDRLNRIFSSKYLCDVMSQLESQDLGVWPSVDYIEKTFNENDLALPVDVLPDGFYAKGLTLYPNPHTDSNQQGRCVETRIYIGIKSKQL